MATLNDLVPDTEALLSLEPEELAGLGLELITSADPNGPSRLHPSTFASPETIGLVPLHLREQVQCALAEGWNWLLREGLIAAKPTDTFGWHFVTRRGMQLKNRAGVAAYANTAALPRAALHPVVAKCCWSAFLRGEYDTAVFQAFRELEVTIRATAKLTPDDIGVSLAQKAFRDNGPLSDMTAPPGERVAMLNLMAGALGSFKNPHSHRRVRVRAEDASEAIILASMLMKIVDARSMGA